MTKIEKTQWGTQVHGDYFKGMRDGGIDVHYLPKDKEIDVPPHIPFKFKQDDLEGILVVRVIYTDGSNRAIEVCTKYCRREGYNGDDYERLNDCEGSVELEVFEREYSERARRMPEEKKRYEPEQVRKKLKERKKRKRKERP